jgi:hypothetical protein
MEVAMPRRGTTCTTALLLLVALLTVGLAACGSGAAGNGDVPDFGTFPLPGGPGGDPRDPPDGGNPTPPPPPALSGGVLFTIDCQGEIFHWWVTNPQTAQDLIDVHLGRRTVISFGGVLVGGQGAGNHNAPWSWHVDPVQNGVDVLTVPESPKIPSECEVRLGYWLSQGVTFIPLSAVVTAYEDLR